MGRGYQAKFAGRRIRVNSLDYREKLHKSASDALQEVIYTKRMMRIATIDSRKGIELDVMLLEQLDAPHHLVKGRASLDGLTMLVVEFFVPVNGDSDEHIVLRQERTPLVIEACGVRLEGILYLLAIGVFFL